jgi:hypothetical protein
LRIFIPAVGIAFGLLLLINTPADYIFAAVIVGMVARLWYHIFGIVRLTRRQSIFEEAAEIIRAPDKYL